LSFLQTFENKGEFSSHELHDNDLLDVLRSLSNGQRHPDCVPFVLSLHDSVNFGDVCQWEFNDSAVALV